VIGREYVQSMGVYAALKDVEYTENVLYSPSFPAPFLPFPCLSDRQSTLSPSSLPSERHLRRVPRPAADPRVVVEEDEGNEGHEEGDEGEEGHGPVATCARKVPLVER
jgi:hypothetical protein